MSKNKVLFIAEAGVNHNGDINLAKKMIDVAVEAGVDIVKFQTFKSEKLVTSSAVMAEYQLKNTNKKESQLDMLKKLELNEKDFIELKNYCQEKNIQFLSTAFDMESLKFLKSLNMGMWKIPSGEITNLPYLEYIGRCKSNVILSTGMTNIDEISAAIQILTKAGTNLKNITVLHCNTDYPTPFEDVNLNAMSTIKKTFGVEVGYSDHTEGLEVSVAAVALGATVIEKHFTLDKNLPGPDHKASIDAAELISLLKQIRNIEKSLGKFEKIPSDSESKNIAIARKSIVANIDIEEGDFFSEENLTVKRPGTGISPMSWYDVIGKKAKKRFLKDEMIEV